ncbi:MAG: DUF1996 domain-containing protein [Actinomycetota bacterium]
MITRRAASLIASLIAVTSCGGSNSDGADASTDGAEQTQFVVRCELSHVSFDDPIVMPWQPGASHQHQFFGNRAVDSNPGYGRVAGADTSCDDPLDTASYWSPTLLDDTGRRVDAVGLTSYYRVGAGVDPADVVAFPPGFTAVAGPTPPAGPEAGTIRWSCGTGWVDIDEGAGVESPPQCADDDLLRLWVTFPDCWDGLREGSFGSGAHVRFANEATDGCPESHPVPIPQLTMAIDFPAVSPDGLSLSSGGLGTVHADFWNTWNQDRLEREVDVCLRRAARCSTG